MIRHLAYLAPLLALACAPVPMTRERAEQLCRDEVELADGVQTRVGIGIGTGGPRAKAGIIVTDRVFDPQSDEEFMAECIARRMAGAPTPTRTGIIIGGSI